MLAESRQREAAIRALKIFDEEVYLRDVYQPILTALKARKWDRVGKIAVTGVTFNFLLSGSLIAIIYLLNRPALGLFLPEEGEEYPSIEIFDDEEED